MSGVHAAFDLALDPRDRGARLRGAFVTPPVSVLRTTELLEVPAIVAAAEAAAADGKWVVGGLGYEAGGAWDASQRTQPGGELAHFAVFDADPQDWPDALAPEDPAWFPAGGFNTPRTREGFLVPPTDQPLTSRHKEPSQGPGHATGTLAPAAAIATAQQHIAAGDCYQVNLTSRYRTVVDSEFDLYAWFAALAARQPGGYAVFLLGAGVASVSPELFFHARPDGRLVTQPMKGTAEATSSPEQLRQNPKERAENLMIVDLLRNDLGRVCRPGTIRVDALFELVQLPTVWQLVSTISGVRRPGVGLSEVFGALFPCGSVTGAPKIRAMQLIAELEGQPRGWYCGALGVIRPGGEAIFNVPIRTVEQRGRYLEYGVGSGIVAASDPAAELAEWRAKARVLGGEPFAALETLLLTEGTYPRADAHLRRLARTDAALGLGIDVDHVADALDHTLAAALGELGMGGAHSRRVRLTARADSIRISSTPLEDFPSPLPLALASEPLDVTTLRPVIEHKTTWRSHYSALREARPGDAFDVICHTPDGLITEATLGNLAFLLDGRWVTPETDVGLLPGVEREARLADGTLIEAEVHLDDLPRAQQVAFLNAARGWHPALLLPDKVDSSSP